MWSIITRVSAPKKKRANSKEREKKETRVKWTIFYLPVPEWATEINEVMIAKEVSLIKEDFVYVLLQSACFSWKSE